jgi:hypothetical protein
VTGDRTANARGGDSTGKATPSESSLEGYLRLEDDVAFIEASCPSTGILAWPAIRQDVLRTLLGDRVYPTTSLAGIGPRRSILRTVPAALGATVWNAAHPPPRADVLLLATGAGLVQVDGRWRNRHVDDFANTLGARAWTIESSFPGLRSMRARWNRRVGSLIVDRARIALASSVIPRRAQRRVMEELLDIVDARGRDLLGWELGDERRAALVEQGASRLAAYPMKARLYTRIFRQIKPRLAIVEEGCYGHMAVFDVIARDRGVKVAEFQHGMVTRGHDAYNVGPILAGSEAYRRTQPYAFLGYGDWWLDQITAPVEQRIAIGNPHRSAVIRHWSPRPDRRSIVVIGDGVETDAHIAFAARVASLVPGSSRVVFRPHPLEAHRVPERGLGVEVDRESDLYSSLSNAHAIVAESSTVLFEALGLVPRVFAWDTPKSRFYLGSHPFEKALDPADLVARLAEPRPSDAAAGASLWADDWERRFREFLERVLDPGAGNVTTESQETSGRRAEAR